MNRIRIGTEGVGALVLGFALSGCGDSPPPVNNSEPEKLSPALEQMKSEMMDKMKKTAGGKAVMKEAKAK